MKVNDGRFPDKPLEYADIFDLALLCGAEPEAEGKDFRFVDPRRFNHFIDVFSPSIEKGELRFSLNQLAAKVSWDLGLELGDGVRTFDHGAKIYAGVLAVVGSIDPVPHEPAIVEKMVKTNPTTLIRGSQTQLKVAGFKALLDALKPALGTWDSERLHLAAVTGAGAIHFLAVSSLNFQAQMELDNVERDMAAILEQQTRELDSRLDAELGAEFGKLLDLFAN